MVLGVLGLAFGSFINAFVWRLHTGRNWVSERSECPQCGHELAAVDLVPVLSWLWLKGRCRYCAKPITWQYPAVELLTAGLYILSYLHWPNGLDSTSGQISFAIWLISIIGLVSIAVYDLRWFIIPDQVVYSLIYLAIAKVALNAILFGGGPLLVKDAVVGLLIGGGLFYAIFQFSDGRWIGGGDVKLGIFFGILLGARDAFIAVYVAAVAGAVVMSVLLLTKKVTRKTKIPFGPFLILGILIAGLYGSVLWGWYSQLLV